MSVAFSVFTPTHRPDHLPQAFASLAAQTRVDWEWVIVPNGPDASVPDHIARDPRVRVIVAPDANGEQRVGALKRFACEHCRGDLLVELDHDDLLLPHALARIGDAAQQGAAGFIYSDCANFREDGSCDVYDGSFGWESYAVAETGCGPLTAMRAFAADASSLHLIFFAPNHVRAWHRDAYAQAGGHDAALAVADDHDLMCRTWLSGAPFHHIPECLYLYRLHADGRNTFVQRNAEIQQRQQEISNRYVHALIAEWCRRGALPMVSLGSASDCPPGYTHVGAAAAAAGVTGTAGIPFPDGSVGCVRAYDCLQYVPPCAGARCDHGTHDGEPGRCVVGMMNEIYRVLAPGGWLVSRTPSSDGRDASAQPRQQSLWNAEAFRAYTQREYAQHIAGLKCRFQATRVWQDFPDARRAAGEVRYVYADLVALKGQRQPGICAI